MGKFLKYIILVTLVCLTLSGCSGKGENLTEHQKNIRSAAVTWELHGREYSANVELGGASSSSVTVISPENIAGLTLTYGENGAAASVGTVSFPLSENMGREVYRIVRSLCPNESERKGGGDGDGTSVLYESEMFGGITSFDVTYGEDKYPKSAKITWDGIEMTVTYGNIIAD